MKTKLLLALLISTSVSAYEPFNRGFFHPGFNQNIWHDFDRQFREFEQKMRQAQYQQQGFATQSRNYFDQDNNQYVIEIKVDGLDKDNLEINTEEGMINIRGKKVIKRQSGNNTARASSSFSQSLSLPEDADTDDIQAKFEDSILRITLPKLSAPKPKTQTIEIE